jgi:hypothetical protein
VAVTALFAWPYAVVTRELGFVRPAPPWVPVDRFLDVLPQNLLYARLLGIANRNQNAAHFLGFLAMGLALAGALWRRDAPQGASRLRPFLVVLALAGFLLSLGPRIQVGSVVLGPGPYELLRCCVPGFRNVRYPERLSILLILAFAPLVAMGVARLRPRLGRLATMAVLALLFLEHVSIPQPSFALPAGDTVPSVYRWLRDQPDIKVTAEAPAAGFFLERADALPMYFSTVHWKRTVQGYTSYFAPTYHFIKWRLFHLPDDASIRFLRRFGVDAVVVAPEAGALPPWARADPRWSLEGPFEEGHVVLRLPGARLDVPPPPSDEAALVEIDRSGWELQASTPGAPLAVDDREETAWVSSRPQQEGDFLRVRFPEATSVARVTFGLRDPDFPQSYEFPMRLELRGRPPSGEWQPVAFDEEATYDRLFASLLHDGPRARFVLDLPGAPLRALELRIRATDQFWMPWAVTELRAYRRR